MPDDRLQPPAAPKPEVPRELAEVVRAGVKAARLVPGAVAVGGTVCALYATHRLSFDIDFVIRDLKDRFEDVSETLEAVPGWVVKRTRPQVMILGKLDGVDIGYRQLRRTAPLDTTEVQTPDGPLVVPTLEELLRIKAFLACERRYTRDFLDLAELSRLLPVAQVVEALAVLDEKVGWDHRPAVALEVLKALAECAPIDGGTHGFETFRFLTPRVKSWDDVRHICRDIAAGLSTRLLGGQP